jgi:hypothetical protein
VILWPGGITASQYSHVEYFPNQDAYSEYYDFVVDICDIGVESFATRAQTMLVDHLREHYGDGIANWCKTFLDGNTGTVRDECVLPIVGMLDARTTWESKCPGATSRRFYLQTAHWGSSWNPGRALPRREHMQRLSKVGSGNAFIRKTHFD